MGITALNVLLKIPIERSFTNMDEQRVRRPRRTAEQRAADIDAKIQKLNEDLEGVEAKRAAAMQEFDAKAATVKDRIEALEQQKKEILAPKPPRKPRKTKKQKIQELIQTASKSGLKPEEIAERLGLAQTEE